MKKVPMSVWFIILAVIMAITAIVSAANVSPKVITKYTSFIDDEVLCYVTLEDTVIIDHQCFPLEPNTNEPFYNVKLTHVDLNGYKVYHYDFGKFSCDVAHDLNADGEGFFECDYPDTDFLRGDFQIYKESK